VTLKKKSKLFTEKDLIRDSTLKTPERFILYLIHEYCGDDGNGFATQKTFARISGLSERRVRQAIQFLRDNGILNVTTKRSVGYRRYNHYTINIARLFDFQQEQPAPRASNVKTDKPENDASDTPHRNDVPPGMTKSASEREAPRASINERGNEHIETKGAEAVSDGRLFPDSEEGDSKKSNGKKPRKRKPRIGTIKPEEFDNLDTGLERFAEFLSVGLVIDLDRLRFLTLWLYVRDKSGPGGNIRNPAGVLFTNIRKEDWHGSNTLEDEANRFLIQHDRSQPHKPLSIIQDAADNMAADVIQGIGA